MLGPVVCDIVGTTLSEIEKRRIAHPLVGMVILFARNYENRTQLEKLCQAIHDIKPGVLIGVDHEGGRVQRFRDGFTEIPAMSAYGRAYRDDPEATARALTAAGFVMASTNGAVQIACNLTLKNFGGDLYIGIMTDMSAVVNGKKKRRLAAPL